MEKVDLNSIPPHVRTSGVYAIHNNVTGKYYVGSSKRISKRILDHRSDLKRNCHCNAHLQNSWNKYGEIAFDWYVLEITDLEFCRDQECVWISKLNSFRDGYNLSETTEVASGFTFKHTEEFKQKMSQLRKGIKFSDDHKRKLSVARRSYKQPPDVIEKARQSNIGKKRSQAARDKMSAVRREKIEQANQIVRSAKGRSASGYKGVYQKKNKWQVKAKIDGTDKNLGSFSDIEEAAKHYDYYMLKHYGRGVFLNFPDFDYSSFVPVSTRPRKKLTYHIAEEIRIKHHSGIGPKQLAVDYRLSVTMVYKILNNLVYKPKDVATVSVVYNPASVCASGCRVVDPSGA